MILFASRFRVGKAQGCGTFRKCTAGLKLNLNLILGPLFWLRVPSKVRKFLQVLQFSYCLRALVVGKVETRTGLSEDETCAQKDP